MIMRIAGAYQRILGTDRQALPNRAMNTPRTIGVNAAWTLDSWEPVRVMPTPVGMQVFVEARTARRGWSALGLEGK
jgi:hypothetical protein